MTIHNKLTFTDEYCKCRRIPHRIKGEALFIGSKQVCFSLYILSYGDIITMIDNLCDYDMTTTYFDGFKGGN